ncbi:hypothetical protein [Microbacterium sp.]|uniref:hypothetical protein n=1 Tax=Microbacterium sp. TaxID=51671 RepID=UPI003A92DB4D
MTYYTIGGDFLADGTVRAFANPRTKSADNQGHFGLTYSELFNPATGQIMVGDAYAIWAFGLKNVATGSIYWCDAAGTGVDSSGFIHSSINALKKGTYVVVCKSHYAHKTGTSTYARIRFGGKLSLT